MNSKIDSKIEDENFQKKRDELYKYLKKVLNINKTLSSAFVGITLTAFVFLISLGYPDILDEVLVIGGTSIKIVQAPLGILVLSFFSFLLSTIIYHLCELNLIGLYLFKYPEITSSIRFEKSEKLYNRYYQIANGSLFFGVFFLITAVIFIFIYFSPSGIILVIGMSVVIGILMVTIYLSRTIYRYFKNKEKSLKI